MGRKKVSEVVAHTEMGFLDHLRELRTRLINVLLGVAAGSVIAFLFSTELAELLNKPYFDAFGADSMLTGTGPAEAFVIRMEISIFGGVLIAAPVIFYQIWAFIAPGLYSHERKFVIPFVVVSTSLFMLGVWFCYRWVFPFAFSFFFEQYRALGITAAVRMTENMGTMIQGLVGFGAVFEMPVLAFFLGRAGIIDHKTLLGGMRYAVVIIFIVSAVLTPPDVLTQFIMAGPLMLLYLLSIVIVKYTAAPREAEGDVA